MEKISVDFTPDEFEKLIHLVHLGNWMINSHRSLPINGYENLQQIILEKASEKAIEHDFEDIIDRDEDTGKYQISSYLEEDLSVFVDEYDLYTFWEELGYELAERDLNRKCASQKSTEMTAEDRIMETEKIAEQYFSEFQQNGVENIIILNNQ